MYVSQHVCLRLCLPLYQVAHPARVSQYPLYMYEVTRSIVTPPDGILIHCKSPFSISLGSTSLLGTHDWILFPPPSFFSLWRILRRSWSTPTNPQPHLKHWDWLRLIPNPLTGLDRGNPLSLFNLEHYLVIARPFLLNISIAIRSQ